MSRELRPTTGVRFLLERTRDGDTRAEYRAAIYTPTDEFVGVALLEETGGVTLAPTGAPPGLDEMLAMQAKLLARGAGKRRADGLPAWPLRLLRWRGPGRGG